MEKVKAEFELLGMQAKAAKLEELEFVTLFTNLGLPQEVITRLQALFYEVKVIAGQTINIGKIILMKLMEFVKENQNMAIGLAIGIGISVLASALAAAVPLFGSFLAGIAFTITALIAIPLGALRGHRLDKVLNGEITGDSLIEDMITIAKKFWALLVDIFSAVKDSLEEKSYA
jgi:Zn-dependent protease